VNRKTPAGAPLALTMGEPAGIGGEIALMAWARRRALKLPPFFLIDDPKRLASLARRLRLKIKVLAIAQPGEASAAFARGLPVLAVALPKAVEPGHPSPDNGQAVLKAIDMAISAAMSGAAGAVVTNPIHKETMYRAGFRQPGHTEYLAERTGAGAGAAVMMLAVPGLRVVPVTVHLPLKDALASLTTEKIVACGRVAARALGQDFGIARPRLAVAGVNPHAGEGGALGREEIDIVRPAVERLEILGIDATGPEPADTLFHGAARRRYDAALCMYHDQALVPLKTIDFFGGVNVTLGLPIVRTSPDHGTALALAGTGKARPDSLIAALKLAAKIAARRRAGKTRA
jgi:4-hydroxythreonine-4-phosphate dehydrogenase